MNLYLLTQLFRDGKFKIMEFISRTTVPPVEEGPRPEEIPVRVSSQHLPCAAGVVLEGLGDDCVRDPVVQLYYDVANYKDQAAGQLFGPFRFFCWLACPPN
uniref:(northern house mosquito) hypothetical protein n=1 Tax=Culex pipiens TaxID=7175 RepID=A0A8D8B1L0_CULPI